MIQNPWKYYGKKDKKSNWETYNHMSNGEGKCKEKRWGKHLGRGWEAATLQRSKLILLNINILLIMVYMLHRLGSGEKSSSFIVSQK